MAIPDDQITVLRRELESIAADIKTIEALLDVQKILSVRSQEMLDRMKRGALQ
jgi:hypothetical protein